MQPRRRGRPKGSQSKPRSAEQIVRRGERDSKDPKAIQVIIEFKNLIENQLGHRGLVGLESGSEAGPKRDSTAIELNRPLARLEAIDAARYPYHAAFTPDVKHYVQSDDVERSELNCFSMMSTGVSLSDFKDQMESLRRTPLIKGYKEPETEQEGDEDVEAAAGEDIPVLGIEIGGFEYGQLRLPLPSEDWAIALETA